MTASADNPSRHFLKICRPAFLAVRSTDIHNSGDPLYDILLGEEEKILGRAPEYGWRAWRIKGSRHTLICWDEGNGYFSVMAVEECHHDETLLDELYAAACVLSYMNPEGKEVLLKNCSVEKLRECISKHFDYIYAEITQGEGFLLDSPPPILAELIREARKRGKHIQIIEKLDKETLFSIARHAPDLGRMLIPYII